MIKNKQKIVIGLVICFILSVCYPAMGLQAEAIPKQGFSSVKNSDISFRSEPNYINLDFSFSDPVITEDDEYSYVSVAEADFNHIADGEPVLPVKLVLEEFIFGTEIISVTYEISTPVTVSLLKKISFGRISPRGTDMDEDIYGSSNLFPADWVTYHTGGGLSGDNLKTFLAVRIYPARYNPLDDELQYVTQISLNITYAEPDQPPINENSDYDLLILAPSEFKISLQPLVNHKIDNGVTTELVELSEVYNLMSGRDKAEKIKYYIKDAIETKGIHYVLLVGGMDGQGFSWHLPVRYSHVVPPDEQEYAEESFISDLYYADIYDSLGDFSSWDSNENDIFSEWDETNKDEMDLYPDVYLGRLACRYNFEVITMVNKIINYEDDGVSDSWFKNMVLIAGDSYNDSKGVIEGEVICEQAFDYMPGFNAVRLYAAEDQDIDKDSVKQVIDPGCGFAYFCGHGSPGTWSTHYPPNAQGWVTGFDAFDMIHLKNKEKLPIVVIGGCLNNRFDVTILNLFINLQEALQTSTWMPRCWGWWLTCKIGGGAIATIGSTGLGTHGREDADNNNIADYLEVLDGWLELRFFQLYGIENSKVLGENHGISLTEYLHTYIGSDEKMDVKMVQQWILFGDPSLQIGGY